MFVAGPFCLQERKVAILKIVKYDFDSAIKELRLCPLGDFHVGDHNCDEKSIKALLKCVEQDEFAYSILNGDFCDNAIKDSVSDSYKSTMTPDDQIDYVCCLLYPTKDKILFADMGNHEYRTWKQSGVDIMGRVMKELGIGDRYAAEGGVGFIRFGQESSNHHRKVRYSFYATHGKGNGKKEGGKVNAIADLAPIVDTDMYIMSHTHLPFAFKEDFLRVDNNNNTVSQVTKLFVNTSSQLNYGGYGQTGCFKPSCKDTPVVYLSGTKRDMHALI